MPVLDYSIQGFEFKVGSFDVTKLIDSVTIKLPISEPEEPLVWTGDFELSWTLEAQRSGITEADLSELSTPNRWRRGLQSIAIKLKGYSLPILRIESYHYDSQTGRGSGKLTQALALLDQNRPSEQLEIKAGSTQSIGVVVRDLLQLAPKVFGSAGTVSLNINFDLFNRGLRRPSSLDVPITTETPIKDAQRLSGIHWLWLWQNKNSEISIVARDGGNPLFVRGLKQVEIEPNLDGLEFAAERVIVTGARQVSKKYIPKNETEEEPPEDTDDQGRPRRIVTETKKPAIEVLPGQRNASTEPILAERKTIYYLYLDGKDVSLVGTGLPASILFYTNKLKQPYSGWDDVVATLTTFQRPVGSVFPQARGASGLIFAEVTLEGYQLKTTWKPAGLIKPADGANPGLIIASEELVKSGNTIRNPRAVQRRKEIDPKTGEGELLEELPEREPRQKAPEWRLETQTFKGETRLNPVGFNTFYKRQLIKDFGFLPSQEVAQRLSEQIAAREIQRRDSRIITMPLPEEWLSAGCPPLVVCDIGNGRYIMEAPIIDIGDGSMTLRFQGDRVGTITEIPNPVDPVPVVPSGLYIAPIGSVMGLVGSAIASIQLAAVGGSAPYTFTGSLPSGLSISSGGLISGTPSATANGLFAVTVTDNDGTVATLDISFVFVGVSAVEEPFQEIIQLDLGYEFGMLVSASDPLPPVELGYEFGMLVSASDPVAIAVGYEFGMDVSAEETGGGGY